MTTRNVRLPVTDRGMASAGAYYSDVEKWEYWRDVLVDADGTVWAYDDIAGCYSRHHDLTPGQVAHAQTLAEANN